MIGYINDLSNFKKVVIYIRESTSKQDWKSQLQQVQEQAKYMKANVVAEYVDIASGRKSDRKNYLRMKENVLAGKIDLLMFWELSRSTRNLADHIELMGMMIEKNVFLYSLTDGGLMDPADIDQELSLNLKAVINMNESKRGSRRVRNRSFFLSQQGRWLGGPVPYGYINNSGFLSIHPVESEQIKKIFQLFLSGEHRGTIARVFGFEPKKVTRIIKNVVYAGLVKYGEYQNLNGKRVLAKKQISNGKHDGIISVEDFEKAQVLLDSQYYKPVLTEYSDTYLFGGILKCFCGCTMYGWQDAKTKSIYYKCSSSWKLKKSCGKKIVAIEEFEAQVLELIKQMNFNLEDTEEEFSPNEKIPYLTSEIAKLTKQEKFLLDSIVGNIDDLTRMELYQKKLDLVSKDRQILERELEKLSDIKPRSYLDKKIDKTDKIFLNEFIEKIKTENDRNQMKKLLRVLVNNIVFINDFRIHIFFNFSD